MGKEYNDLRKKATRFLAVELSTGKGLTVADMVRKVQWEFGLGEKFVLDFLETFGNAVVENDGVFLWKK